MTLEDKIGQMVQADIGSIQPADLLHYKLGSILAGGFAAPDNNPNAAPAAWRAMVGAYKAAALSGAGASHPAIPILFGIDAVHGNAKVRGATIYPHNIGLGAAHDPDLIHRIGEATAQEVSAVGIDWAFAPTVAVVQDVRWGRSYESYADDPSLVAAYATAMVTGLQGEPGEQHFLSHGHVVSSAKHFIGDGGTAGGRDQGDTRIDESALRDIHGAGYRAALVAGVATIMASYSSWNGEKSHANESLLTGVLKQRWGFDGFVVGDWNAQEELPGCTKFSCAAQVDAGVDMVMAPDSWKGMYDNLLDQARRHVIPAVRIDDAVRRILRVKALAGLIGPAASASPASASAAPVDLSVLGNASHRALAREAVRKSLVLLKNDHGLLPLDPRRHVLVVGAAADSIGQQCGGWTVDWQGTNHPNADFPGATSIFAGIKAAVEARGGVATFSADGNFTARPDVAIVVYGESPYAEFEGDRENLLLPDANGVDAMLHRLRDKAIPVVSVLLSGRPLWTNPQINLSQAFLAAWLPGSEGEGVADLLFRHADGVAPDFTGRLSVAWPATGMPAGIATDGRVAGALFPRGYGLSLQHPSMTPSLPEDPLVPGKWDTHDTFYGAGHVVAPWSIYIADSLSEIRVTLATESSPADALQISREGEAIRAAWSGAGGATWRLGGRAIDLSEAAASGQALVLRYRLIKAPSRPMHLGLQCGEQCGAWIDITHALGTASSWQTLSVPLACLAHTGADLRQVETPIALRTDGAATMLIDQVSLTAGHGVVVCPVG